MSNTQVVQNGLRQCYRLWQDVWSSTLRELDGLSHLHSDDFSRQDFFSTLWYGDEIAALCGFRFVDLQQSWGLADSWFAPWQQTLLCEIAQTRPRAMVPSWLTAAPAFRKTAGYTGPNVTGLLSELISLHLLESDADVAFGTPRRDRSVHRWIARAGATCLAADVLHHGVPIDLVAFFPERLRSIEFSNEVMTLWSERTDFRHRANQPELAMPKHTIETQTNPMEEQSDGPIDRAV